MEDLYIWIIYGITVLIGLVGVLSAIYFDYEAGSDFDVADLLLGIIFIVVPPINLVFTWWLFDVNKLLNFKNLLRIKILRGKKS